MNIHFHTLVLDGVFTTPVPRACGFIRRRGRATPRSRRRWRRSATGSCGGCVRHGLGRPTTRGAGGPGRGRVPGAGGDGGASVQGRVALGPRAGARVRRLGGATRGRVGTSRGPRQAHLSRGSTCTPTWRCRGEDRERREQLCRYLLRPAVAQERLRLAEDGRIVLELKRPWQDGTSDLVFEPLDLLERLAALTPRPRINLIIYHGVAGPQRPCAGGRGGVRDPGGGPAGAHRARRARGTGISGRAGTAEPEAARRGWTWAQLMHRAFDRPINCTAHPRCGGTGADHAPVPSSLRAGASGSPPPPAGASGPRLLP